MRRARALGIWVGLAFVSGLGMPAEAANWAELMFAERGHDFGPVPRGAKVRHPFIMVNRYSEPVTILDVRASCGCTTGRASTATLAPGQQAVIEAEMDTRNFVGKKATTLTITMVSASGKEAEAQLAVSSNILSDIVLNPGTLDFGAVARGQTPQLSLTIDRIGAPNWQVIRMLSSGQLAKILDPKSTQIVETRRDRSGVSYQLTAALRADAPAGIIRDEIRIMTNDRESPVVPVLVTGLIRGELSATPSVLNLGRVSSAGKAQGKVLVRAGKPFTVREIQGQGDGFAATVDDQTPRALHVVTITYDPETGRIRGDLRRTFRVQTDLADEPALDLNATLHVDP